MSRSIINRLAVKRAAWMGVIWGVLAGAGSVITGCAASDIVGDPAGSSGGSSSPDAVSNPAGALAFYNGVVASQATTYSQFTLIGGLLADELASVYNTDLPVDTRRLPENIPGHLSETTTNDMFSRLQKVRAAARQGRGVVAEFLPVGSAALAGHLYAIEAMADVALAELFCSGIPLSTVNYDGTVTLRGGSSSTDVYQTAVALFDSAIALSGDSATFLNFAKVGKGRALLNLGDFQGAAAAVADVPLDYQYRAEFAPLYPNAFIRPAENMAHSGHKTAAREGMNGFPFGVSHDWRTDTVPAMLEKPMPSLPGVGREPRKYAWSGDTPIIVASGVEARLIEAEADLHAGGTQWRTILNDLRATCTPDASCSPVLVPIPSAAPLPEIVDPGTASTRVDTLFAERAAWLYLTGHREGDLRRLIRQYQRVANDIYPTGVYREATNFSSEYSTYGTFVNFPIPVAERTANAKFTGCMNRGA